MDPRNDVVLMVELDDKIVNYRGLSHFWDRLAEILDGKVAFTDYGTSETPGVVKSDNATVQIGEDGTLSVLKSVLGIDRVDISGMGNAITSLAKDPSDNRVLKAVKGRTFLTEHPTITVSPDGSSQNTPKFGDQITLVASVTKDANGHITQVNNATITIPNTTVSSSANGLMTKELFNTLNQLASTSTIVEKSNTNGNIKINSHETTVYTLPDATTTIKGGLKVPGGNGLQVSAGSLTMGLASGSTPGAMSAADYSKLAAFENASVYAKKSDISNVYKWKGSVETYDDLPDGASGGDVYDVKDTGMNYAWDDSEQKWDALGSIMQIDTMSAEDINTMMA